MVSFMGKKYCTECGAELSENSNFCGECGHKLDNNKTTTNSSINSNNGKVVYKSNINKIFISLIIIVIVAFVGAFMLFTASSDATLVEQNFNFLTISVPSGSDFFIDVDLGTSMTLTNNAKYSKEARTVIVEPAPFNENTGYFVFQNKTGDVTIYKHESEDYYRVDRIVGNYNVIVIGTDLDLITKMVETAKCY